MDRSIGFCICRKYIVVIWYGDDRNSGSVEKNSKNREVIAWVSKGNMCKIEGRF